MHVLHVLRYSDKKKSSYPFLLFNLSLNVRVHSNTSYGNGRANSSLCANFVACEV
jgi:hypothetical protein